MIGETIAHYRITAKLGEGGMGEVYRAHDPRLGRDVAIKFSREQFSERFEREARAIAALNHPNICHLYDVGPNYLVMELIEGETLKGPLPQDQALRIAKQIADAMEAAHERGIIHRDLKPANVKITPDGTVKVLDFGLAKSSEQPAGDQESSPTLTMSPTRGMILGTAPYMSPEQAAGKPVDKRSDIWSFGVVLWEMLTGDRLFEGETISHTLADVLRAPIDFNKLPKNTAPAIRNLLKRCLERDVKKRLRDIGEARFILEEPIVAEPETARGVRTRSWLPWSAAAVLLVLAAALAFVHFREAPAEAPVVRTFIPPPDGHQFNFTGGLSTTGPVALSPDGRRMTFSAKAADGKNQLWIRGLDALAAQPLPGTEGAIHPFWSSDSRFIGFFASGKLKKIDASGGPPLTLCDAESGRGGSWNEAGVIIFAPNGSNNGFQIVSASGGVPRPVILDVPGRWPWFLPDGRHFLYSAGATVRLGSLDSKDTKVLVETMSDAVYSQGHLIYLRDDTLMAQPFDGKRLKFIGEPVPIAENVRSVGAQRRGVFSVSQNGMLAYQSGAGVGRSVLTWFDRTGKRVGTLGEAAELAGLNFSPNRKTVATTILDPMSHTYDVWLNDVATGLRTRFTFDGSRGANMTGIWSPDGASIVFDTFRSGKWGLQRKNSNLSGGEEHLIDGDTRLVVTSWSPDGNLILYNRSAPDAAFVLPLDGERKPIPVLKDGGSPLNARFSPDGRWIAYTSLETQGYQVFISPFPGAGGRILISANGGTQPRWRGDGKEIFYVAPDNRLMAVEVRVDGPALSVARVQPLFSGVPYPPNASSYDVALDGQRFLVVAESGQATPEPLTLVQNWTAGIRK